MNELYSYTECALEVFFLEVLFFLNTTSQIQITLVVIAFIPENMPYETPTINPETKDSMAAIRFSVASPNSPPNVTIGVRQAK